MKVTEKMQEKIVKEEEEKKDVVKMSTYKHVQVQIPNLPKKNTYPECTEQC